MMVATKSLEEELRSWRFQNPIYNLTRGVKLNQFYPGKPTLFNDMKGPIALYVGRIAIEKNIEDFLKMEWEGTKVLVGDGPSKQSLQHKYPNALFTGIKEGTDLAEHYRSSDLFVFPSRTDTFGMVLIEAMASGLPVAAYDVTGPKDIITESFMGTLDEDLATAAKKALSCGSPEKRAAYIHENYTWEKVGSQFEKIITGNT